MDAPNPRALPAMHRLLAAPAADALLRDHPRAAVAAALRRELDALVRRFRFGRPAVVGRLAAGRLVLDLRTVADAEVEALARAVRAALVPP